MLLFKPFHEGGQDIRRLHLGMKSYGLDKVMNLEYFFNIRVVSEYLNAEIMIKPQQ